MGFQRNNPSIGIPATGTIIAQRMVTAAGIHSAVSTTDDVIGVSQDAQVSGDTIACRLRTAGTVKISVDGAIALGGIVYKGANGQGSPTSTGSVAIGRALEASSAANDVIEVQLY